MEMPVDILTHRLGKIRDNGTIDFDQTAAALDIDSELQEKFLSIPYEEIDAIEISQHGGGPLAAGDGPEGCTASPSENPQWLYNHAMNALALWRKLVEDEKDAERLRKEQEMLDNRPDPGVYLAKADKSGGARFTVIVTEDLRVMVPASLEAELGLKDHTQFWDDAARHYWVLKPVNVEDGSVG